MPKAFVLINYDLGSKEEEVINELKELPELVEIYPVYGSYDLLAKISTDTMDKLKETITWRIRRNDKIKSTLTLIVIEGQGSPDQQ
jgi:DNA-binding Lrp family transcriptional regulator